MVGSIGSTSNLIQMITSSYNQNQSQADFQIPAGGDGPPPPPPPPAGGSEGTQDPLGVFSTVDSDSDNSISESEYNTLTEGILEITGNAITNSFTDYDTDGDGVLNGSELRSVLDEAGFAPPPPPRQVIAAYEAQNGENEIYQTDDESMLTQLLEYLETRTKDLDITA